MVARKAGEGTALISSRRVGLGWNVGIIALNQYIKLDPLRRLGAQTERPSAWTA